MKSNFKQAIEHVLVHEGGWANHPRDPGGATMKGVTLATFRRHYGRTKSKTELRNITDDQLEKIYKEGYWDKCSCDKLPKGIDYAVFDAAVNSGPSRSAKWLQYAVGAKQDGGIGPKTLSKVKKYKPVQITNDMCDRRLSFMRSLSTWSTFGVGWARRVESVRSNAISMSQDKALESTNFKTVKKGSKGQWVEKLQLALEIHVDGDFGLQTEKTLKKWQKENGLEADGIAGRVTYRSLGLLA